ncbi:MAG TPA: 4-hydroxybenzoate octaprenyltransferase [Steroidobacteraceae bacterium]|nr:4-hydroxybenzoate octaprenyltransferase [Steroidobacteraceae bacterium]
MLNAARPGGSQADDTGSGPRRAVTTLVDYARLMRLDRPIGIWLLLWPALWALWLASHGHPDEHVFIVFALGVLLMRSAGCAINDFADRRFDPHVARTEDRPLAAGRVSPAEALLIYAILSLLALALVCTLDSLTVKFAVGGAVLTIVYPFLKRFFPLPQVWLGAAFSWSIPMAFAAETGQVPRLAWLLFVAAVLWSATYDTMYAMVDRDDDLKLGIKSAAILFGDADRWIIGAMQVLVLYAFWLAGQQADLGRWFWIALSIGACLFAWQQWLIRAREPPDCFRAFLSNNWFGLAIFVGIALDYLFAKPGH